MQDARTYPAVLQVVIDTTNARALAEFYRQLLGYEYREGDAPPPAGEADPNGQDWLVLRHASTGQRIAFQQVRGLRRSTWPENDVPQQLHLDLLANSKEEFDEYHARALALGARLLLDRSDSPQEPLHVYADPDGHPFCIFYWRR